MAMNRARSYALAILMCLVAGGSLSAEDAKDLAAKIRVPEGFVVEVAAAPPLVERPIMAGFDDRGRLYVAESSGLNLPAAELETRLPNSIRRLEDVDGDGRFDRSTIFADKMTMPQGALWYGGALYVASPPYIWRLEDTNDDGIADKRKKLVGTFGYNGNAADIHGCFLGPSGRIYWCDGRHGHEFKDPQGHVLSKGLASRIFSCEPDGSDIQVHCGGGMDNPVEIDFTPEGEMIGTVNLLYEKRGDCLVHWMYGGVYPREDQQSCIDEFKRTGDLLPAVHDLGHVAVSGMLSYRSSYFGEAYRDAVFVCEFNTHKVCRLTLSRDGSTFSARREEFLATDSPDFHPTDVVEDADGSLLVIDTGGWFRIGCPTSQVAKPEVTGGIYRIRRVDRNPVHDPRGLTLPWKDASGSTLIARLADPRPAVYERAVTELARRGAEAIEPLNNALHKSASPRTRLAAVWALTRIKTPAATTVLQAALRDGDARVRQAAAHGLGILRDPVALDFMCQLVVDDEPAVRRAVATALGRMGRATAVPALIQALRSDSDRLLEHALIYALIEINAPSETLAGLSDPNPRVRKAVLWALDQMDSRPLVREQVAVLLDTDDLSLQQAAVQVISRHPNWGRELEEFLRRSLLESAIEPERQAMVRGALLAFERDEKLQALIGEVLSAQNTPAATRLLLLDVVSHTNRPSLPKSWIQPLEQAIQSPDTEVALHAVAAIRGHEVTFATGLEQLVRNASRPVALRAAAVEALARAGRPLDGDAWNLLLGRLRAGSPPLERLAAAEAIGSAKLSAAQLKDLTNELASLGPLELPAALRAFEKTSDAAQGLQLVQSLEKSPGLPTLSASYLRELFGRYPAQVIESSAVLLTRQSAIRDQQLSQITSLEAKLPTGNPILGKEVFFGTKASCSACHAVAGRGGQIGPELTKIGGIRTGRDLAESVLLPSQSLARGFESYRVVTTSGITYSGVLKRQTAEAVWLRTADRAELRVERSEIEDLVPSTLSIMPEGLDRLLTPEELAHLVAYLQSLK